MCGCDQFSEMGDLFFRQRRFHSRDEHGENFSATPAGCKVGFPPHNFVRLQRLFVVRRDQFGIGALLRAAVCELVQGFAHSPRERFFSMAIA
jgi:hypothetical protein